MLRSRKQREGRGAGYLAILCVLPPVRVVVSSNYRTCEAGGARYSGRQWALYLHAGFTGDGQNGSSYPTFTAAEHYRGRFAPTLGSVGPGVELPSGPGVRNLCGGRDKERIQDRLRLWGAIL